MADETPWVRTSERLPRCDVEVLAYCEADGYTFCGYRNEYYEQEQDDLFMWNDPGRQQFEIYGVTHWRPMPPMPDGWVDDGSDLKREVKNGGQDAVDQDQRADAGA